MSKGGFPLKTENCCKKTASFCLNYLIIKKNFYLKFVWLEVFLLRKKFSWTILSGNSPLRLYENGFSLQLYIHHEHNEVNKSINVLATRVLFAAIKEVIVVLFSTIEPEEPTVKVGLTEKNYAMVQENRFHSSITSILFKDGLKLNKRKGEHLNAHNIVSERRN